MKTVRISMKRIIITAMLSTAVVLAQSPPSAAPVSPAHLQTASVALRPGGQMLAEGGFKEVRLLSLDGKQIGSLPGEADMVRAVAFSPDGKLVAAAGGLPARKGEVKIWDVEKREVVSTVAGHSDCIYASAFSPDGKQIATSSYDKLIKIWDVASGKEIRTLKDHIDAVFALAWSGDGKRLVSGSQDRSVKIWDAATGTRLFTLSDPQDSINTIALDPTGHHLAAGGFDQTIRIWSLDDKGGNLEQSLIAFEEPILKLAWSPDGKMLAASAGRTVKLYHSADLSEIETLPEQSDWVYGLVFLPDNKTLISTPFDGSFHAYAVSGGDTKVQRAQL